MMRLFLFLSAFVTSMVASAADFGLEAGFRSQSADYTSGSTNNTKNNFQFGGVGQFEFSGQWKVRSGLLYTQRSTEFKVSGNTLSATMTYFDIPGQIMYKFEDYGGVFFGPVLSMNLEKKCEISGGATCELESVKTPIIPLQLGGTFKFMPQFGATLYYEMISGDVATNLGNSRAVGFNLLFTFD